jgi:hypothetical protein
MIRPCAISFPWSLIPNAVITTNRKVNERTPKNGPHTPPSPRPNKLARAKREFERLLDSYAKGFAEEHEVKDRLAELRAEPKRLEEELLAAEKPPEVVSLHPAAITRYREQVECLSGALRTHSLNGNDEPAAAFRELVESVTVMPSADGEPLRIELRGRLATLLGHDVFPQARVWGERW